LVWLGLPGDLGKARIMAGKIKKKENMKKSEAKREVSRRPSEKL